MRHGGQLISLRELMKPYPMGSLMDHYSFACNYFGVAKHGTPRVRLISEQRDLIILRLGQLKLALDDISLNVSSSFVSRVIDYLGSIQANADGVYVCEGQDYNNAKGALESLTSTIGPEAETKLFFSVAADRARYFKAADGFGPEVSAAFPGTVSDASEANKSFALERWTASVFHSIRCLEAGISAISRNLEIPDPTKGSERNWSNIARKIEAALKAKWPLSMDQNDPHYKQLDRVFASLRAMQNPYRNETMHLASKYDESEASHVMEIVKGLLTQIAQVCDETGKARTT